MIIQLYQIEVKNPEAFYVDFNHHDQSTMFFELTEFLKNQRIDVIGVSVDWHNKVVGVKYILEQRIKTLEIPNKHFVFSVIDKALVCGNKEAVKSTFGLTDDFTDSNQEYNEG